jgi:RNAse (barnase) inhibitor barstar
MIVIFNLIDAPAWFGISTSWIPVISLLALLIWYLCILAEPLLDAWVYRELIKSPFGVLLNNAKVAARCDLSLMRKLMPKPLEQVELLLLEVKAEKDSFERRISLFVGSIEKVGIVPGLLALAFSLSNLKQGQSKWVTALAYATPILYFVGAGGHYLIMSLDRKVKILELVIARKKEKIAEAANSKQSEINSRPDSLTLDLTWIKDDKTLHKYLCKMLSFPEYYGHNFDAFWDCIRDEKQSIMPKTLNVIGLSELASHLPQEAKLLEQSLLDYQKERDVHLILA